MQFFVKSLKITYLLWAMIFFSIISTETHAKTVSETTETANASYVQQRIENASHLRLSKQELTQLLNSDELATFYVYLNNELAWLDVASHFLADQRTVNTAKNNIKSLLNKIIDFDAHYSKQNFIGDKNAYEKPDIIVVLGANQNELEKRLHKAYEFVKKFPEIPIILSGSGRSLPSESQIMYEFFIVRGIKKEYLIKENYSVDTLGNAVFTKLLMRQKNLINKNNILLVTSSFHGLRALYLFNSVFGSNYNIAVALEQTVTNPLKLNILLDKELKGQEQSINNIFTMPLAYKNNSIVNGDECSILYQMLVTHDLYKARWDIARYFANECGL